MRAAQRSVLGAVIALMLVTAGCTANPDPEAIETPTPAATQATPAPIVEESAPADDGLGVDTDPVCAGTPGLVPASDDVEDRLHGYVVPVIRDEGPTENARGDAILDDDDVPVAYTVAEGDTAFAIAQRFCIGYVPYLGWLNSVRRDGIDRLYVGDTINLDRHAITTTGDENGHVLDNDPGIHLPPQG